MATLTWMAADFLKTPVFEVAVAEGIKDLFGVLPGVVLDIFAAAPCLDAMKCWWWWPLLLPLRFTAEQLLLISC